MSSFVLPLADHPLLETAPIFAPALAIAGVLLVRLVLVRIGQAKEDR